MKNYKGNKKDVKYTKNDISDYMNKLTDNQIEKLLNICNKFNIHPVTYAWYNNIEDFYADWV